MPDIPTLQRPLQLPSDKQHGIGAAVKHALMFAPSMTDIMIHEGQVIRAKSARGTLPLHQLFSAIPPFVDGIQDLLQQYPTNEHNPDKAAALLKGKGYAMGSDGFWAHYEDFFAENIRRFGDGTPLLGVVDRVAGY